MKIRQIRNATLKINFAGKTILVDPMLSKKGELPPFGPPILPLYPASGNMENNPLVELPIPVEELLDNVDAVIITHLHEDHWDAAAVELIDKNMPLYVQNEEDSEKLGEQGFKNIYVLGHQTALDDVLLTYVEAKHASNDQMLAVAGKSCGVIFEHKDEPTTYLLGDTVWYENVENTLKKYQPKVAIINAGNNQFSEGGPLVMGAEGVHEVHKTLPSTMLFATHMEAVNHAFLTREELANYAEKHGFSNQLTIPADGEEIVY